MTDSSESCPLEKKSIQVGFYDIEKTIGRGNFAVVKLAQHRITRTKVAIKIIDKSRLDNPGLKKVYREISILKEMHHCNIISLYQVMESSKMLYLVTEYAANGEVYDYITKNKRLTEPVASRMFRQLTRALKYCHDNHIVHRDIKAENLLIDHEMNLKLADFGFGSFYNEDQQLNTWCGSPPYAAPEMFLGKPYDPEPVDVWSLGVILYVLVCGSLPFDAPNLTALRKRVLSGRFRVPFTMSTDCEALLRRMLVRDPTKRIRLAEIEEQKWMQVHSKDDEAKNEEDPRKVRLRYHDQAIRLMRSLGINADKAIESARINCYDHYMAIYLLLCERCRNQAEQTTKQTPKSDDKPVEVVTNESAPSSQQSDGGRTEVLVSPDPQNTETDTDTDTDTERPQENDFTKSTPEQCSRRFSDPFKEASRSFLTIVRSFEPPKEHQTSYISPIAATRTELTTTTATTTTTIGHRHSVDGGFVDLNLSKLLDSLVVGASEASDVANESVSDNQPMPIAAGADVGGAKSGLQANTEVGMPAEVLPVDGAADGATNVASQLGSRCPQIAAPLVAANRNGSPMMQKLKIVADSVVMQKHAVALWRNSVSMARHTKSGTERTPVTPIGPNDRAVQAPRICTPVRK